MPYTLLKFLVWGIAFFAIGVLVGWMLRALRARAEVTAARRPVVDGDAVGTPGRLGDLDGGSVVPLVEDLTEVTPEPEPAPAPEPASSPEPESADEDEPEPEPQDEDEDEPQDEPEPAPDLAAAPGVLGRPVRLDDLTIVEGIGPKIAELCSGIGVTTWRALADTDVATLRSMLDDAGSRYKVHDPSSWPRQAGLLAAGDWEGFRELTDELDGGR